LDTEAWHSSAWRNGTVEVAFTRDADIEATQGVWDELEAVTGGVWRLSVRRDSPHLEAHFAPPMDRGSSESIFSAFKRLAETTTSRR
jgi:hypothetical protein